MAGLSRKDIDTLLNSLEQQGATLVPRKNGWTVRFRNGDTMGVHKTASDTKSFDAMRAIVRRAGLSWPFDGKDKKAMNAASRKKHSENKELVQLWLDEHEVNPVTDTIHPQSIAADLDLHISVIYRVLHALGWTKYAYGQWQHVEQLDPGLAALNRQEIEPTPEPAPVEVLSLPIPQKPDEEIEQGDEDWVVVKLTKGMADLSIVSIFSTYRAAGLDVELRVRSKA